MNYTSESGMTYQQWLVAQIAQGAVGIPNTGPHNLAAYVVAFANAIIEEMTKDDE